MGYGIPIWTRDWNGITDGYGQVQDPAEISPERNIIGLMITIDGTITTAFANHTQLGLMCGLMGLITNTRLIDEKNHNYLDGLDGLDLWNTHKHYFHARPYTDLTLTNETAQFARFIIPLTLPTGLGSFEFYLTFGAYSLLDDGTGASTDGFNVHVYTLYGSKVEGVQEYITSTRTYTGAQPDRWKLPINGRLDAMFIRTKNDTPAYADGIIQDIEIMDGGIPQVSGHLDDLRGWGEAWMEQGGYQAATALVGNDYDYPGVYFMNFDNFIPDQTAMIKYDVTAAGTVKVLLKYTQPQVSVVSQVVTPAVAADTTKSAITEGEMARDVIRPPRDMSQQVSTRGGGEAGSEPSAQHLKGPVSPRKVKNRYTQS